MHLNVNKTIIIPISTLDETQKWFWSQEWQKGELEAENDLKTGRYRVFGNIESALKWLDI